MTATACLLLALALVDGACSGFRSSLGRTGLVRHNALDRRSAADGAVLVVLLLVPAAVLAAVGLAAAGVPSGDLASAGRAMLLVLLPYAALVALALAAYCTLGWRQRYVAMALVLGPFTLLRPLVVLGSVVAAVLASPSWLPALVVVAAAGAVLAVEPLLGRRWRASA